MDKTVENKGEAMTHAVTVEQELNRVRHERALARRNFLKNVTLAGAGVAAGAMFAGCGSNPLAAGPSQTDVLNFALNLEYLEAEFYAVATTGVTLNSSVIGGSSQATGGKKVTFTDPNVAAIAAEIAKDEMEHVIFLRSALGGSAVAEPTINLNALGVGFTADADFLTLARAFEDTGVSAYAGAATLLSGNNLQAAAQILATEAYHAGNIRLNIVQKGIVVTPTDSLDVPPNSTHYFPTDSNGLAIMRTTSQVLAIVYANSAPGTAKGGFYPNGVNGSINTV
jgi:hypothetical protein